MEVVDGLVVVFASNVRIARGQTAVREARMVANNNGYMSGHAEKYMALSCVESDSRTRPLGFLTVVIHTLFICICPWSLCRASF